MCLMKRAENVVSSDTGNSNFRLVCIKVQEGSAASLKIGEKQANRENQAIKMNLCMLTSILGLLFLQIIMTVESRPLTEEVIKSELSHQLKRSADVLQTIHDYELGVFLKREEWRKKKCRLIYNCATVAPQLCTAPYTRFIPPDNNGESLCMNLSPHTHLSMDSFLNLISSF